MPRARALIPFDLGPATDGLHACPACGSRATTTTVLPRGSVRHTSFKCLDCGHHRWLPKPRTGQMPPSRQGVP